MRDLKAIFHIDESDKWGLVLANVDNLLKDLGTDKVEIIVLANSVAVKEYAPKEENHKVLSKVDELTKKGVSFKACRNALAGNEIDEKTLPRTVEVIPAGVTELVKKQVEGYAYIRP